MLHLLLKRMALLIWCRKLGMIPFPILLQSNQKAVVAEQGCAHWTTTFSSIWKFSWQKSNLQLEANNNQPVSFIPPSGLNLSQGITGTLVNQIAQYRNYEESRNTINLDELLAHQRKETALRAIARNKQHTAGLHVVAAGRQLLVSEVVNDQRKRKRHAEDMKSEREKKK